MKINPYKYHYQCTTCGQTFDPGPVRYTCPVCSAGNKKGQPPRGILKVLYDYPALQKWGMDFVMLKGRGFIDLLPVEDLNSFPPLRIGNTPLYRVSRLPEKKLNHNLYIKDDSQNPTWSFKDRASALVSAFAKEKGITRIVAASTGNAGSSLAGICASQGQEAIILVPAGAPQGKLVQVMMYGARLIPVEGTYDDAFDLSMEATQEFGWYNRNTAFNPLTTEGKKTVSFEIYEQCGFKAPSRIFVPVGDGVILSGVYKGFEDLLKLSIIERIPEIVAVQAEGSPNLVKNIGNEPFVSCGSRTIADSISVDIPRNFYMAADFLRKYNGKWIMVSDEQILAASKLLASETGLFAEPASAAAFAGYLEYADQGLIEEGSDNIVLHTGSGLKDIASVIKKLELPHPVKPEPGAVLHAVKSRQ